MIYKGFFLFQHVLKVYFLTKLLERCTFIVFHPLVLYLINDNFSLLFCLFPFLGFFSNECPIFVNSIHHRKLQNGKWQSKDTAWQYSTNIKLLHYSDLQCAHWKYSEEERLHQQYTVQRDFAKRIYPNNWRTFFYLSEFSCSRKCREILHGIGNTLLREEHFRRVFPG